MESETKLSDLSEDIIGQILHHVGHTQSIEGYRVLPKRLLPLTKTCLWLRRAVVRLLGRDLHELSDAEMDWIRLAGKHLQKFNATIDCVPAKVRQELAFASPPLKELHISEDFDFTSIACRDFGSILHASRHTLERLSIAVTAGTTRAIVAARLQRVRSLNCFMRCENRNCDGNYCQGVPGEFGRAHRIKWDVRLITIVLSLNQDNEGKSSLALEELGLDVCGVPFVLDACPEIIGRACPSVKKLIVSCYEGMRMRGSFWSEVLKSFTNLKFLELKGLRLFQEDLRAIAAKCIHVDEFEITTGGISCDEVTMEEATSVVRCLAEVMRGRVKKLELTEPIYQEAVIALASNCPNLAALSFGLFLANKEMLSNLAALFETLKGSLRVLDMDMRAPDTHVGNGAWRNAWNSILSLITLEELSLTVASTRFQTENIIDDIQNLITRQGSQYKLLKLRIVGKDAEISWDRSARYMSVLLEACASYCCGLNTLSLPFLQWDYFASMRIDTIEDESEVKELLQRLVNAFNRLRKMRPKADLGWIEREMKRNRLITVGNDGYAVVKAPCSRRMLRKRKRGFADL